MKFAAFIILALINLGCATSAVSYGKYAAATWAFGMFFYCMFFAARCKE